MAKNEKATAATKLPEGFKQASLSVMYRPEGASPLQGRVLSSRQTTYRGKEQTRYQVELTAPFTNGLGSVGRDGEVKGGEEMTPGQIIDIPERAGIRVLREFEGTSKEVYIAVVGKGKGAQDPWIFMIGARG